MIYVGDIQSQSGQQIQTQIDGYRVITGNLNVGNTNPGWSSIPTAFNAIRSVGGQLTIQNFYCECPHLQTPQCVLDQQHPASLTHARTCRLPYQRHMTMCLPLYPLTIPLQMPPPACPTSSPHDVRQRVHQPGCDRQPLSPQQQPSSNYGQRHEHGLPQPPDGSRHTDFHVSLGWFFRCPILMLHSARHWPRGRRAHTHVPRATFSHTHIRCFAWHC